MAATDSKDEMIKFDSKLMNEALDQSEPEYSALLDEQRIEEDERARKKAEERKSKGILRKVVDTLIPA
jgi:hypothetical protein